MQHLHWRWQALMKFSANTFGILDVLSGMWARSRCNWFPTFRDNVIVSKVRNQLPNKTAPNSRRTGTLTTSLRRNKNSKIGVSLRSCGCTDLEDASHETEILEIHGNVLEHNVHNDVLCLQLTVAFNFQLGQAFDVHVGQSDVKGAAGSTEPRRHGVIT